MEALENIASTEMYYPFTCRNYIYIKEKGKIIQKTEVGHNHAHSFESVVSHLYDSPESFSISKEEEEYYSKQELQYLRRIQKYLLFIEMKDLDIENNTIQRYRNKREKRYLHQYIYSYSKETIQEFTTGNRNFTVRKWYRECPKYREYAPKEYRVLMVDSEDNFRLYVEFTHREVKRYKEIKDKFRDNTFKDNDKIIVTYFKILEEF